MAIQAKRFNWIRSPGAWETMQSWQQKRADMRASFESSSSDAVSRFGAAWSSQITGSATIAAQAGLDRVKAAVKAKTDMLA
jgi:hypothetical protein